MDRLTAFVTAMIALSIGVERIVEILKQLLPWTTAHAWRVQSMAVVTGSIVAAVVGPERFLPFMTADDSGWVVRLTAAFLSGIMASGGSAFWNHILDIIGAVKTVKEKTAKGESTTSGALASVKPETAMAKPAAAAA
jgi:hypothetical protein